MRISDWSSDVCSSDLLVENGHGATSSDRTERLGGTARLARGTLHMAVTRLTKYAFHQGFAAPLAGLARRSDEPVSPGRSHPEHHEPGRHARRVGRGRDPQTQPAPGQDGRAQFRARACRSVPIQRVAYSLNKKQTTEEED